MPSTNSFAMDLAVADGGLLDRVRVMFKVNLRARNYVLYVRRDGSLAVTIPRYGSMRGAQSFIESRTAWIARALKRLPDLPPEPTPWTDGTQVMYRGGLVPLRVADGPLGKEVHLADEFCGLMLLSGDARQIVERHLQTLAVRELPLRVMELARQHACRVHRITVRSQRTRWGSCSKRGTISLNWRLIQTPESVRDYIILHELMHLREMNHSDRFWGHVSNVCVGYREAEAWLKANGRLLAI